MLMGIRFRWWCRYLGTHVLSFFQADFIEELVKNSSYFCSFAFKTWYLNFLLFQLFCTVARFEYTYTRMDYVLKLFYVTVLLHVSHMCFNQWMRTDHIPISNFLNMRNSCNKKAIYNLCFVLSFIFFVNIIKNFLTVQVLLGHEKPQ